MEETWRPAIGYEGIYSVSNLGQVRIDIRRCNRWQSGIILKQEIMKNGYLMVDLYINKAKKKHKVSNLVAYAFIGPRPEGSQVNHKDGVKTNNRFSNLEYVTPSENQKHSFRIGIHKPTRGPVHGMSKLTEKDVLEIREIYSHGNISQRELAKRFNVFQSCVSKIILKDRWKHI